MSGPVWRRIEGLDEQCETCLKSGDENYVEGVVEAGEFKPRHYYCERCYQQSDSQAK